LLFRAKWHRVSVGFVFLLQWDAMVAFPPCTHLASSGARWFGAKRADGRQQKIIDFFKALACADIPKIAIENPVGIMSTAWTKPDQIIQPWEYGHEATKTTCLWLKGFPKLRPTNIVGKGERHVTGGGRSLPKWYNLPPGPDRGNARSETFQGIADVMGQQWGQHLKNDAETELSRVAFRELQRICEEAQMYVEQTNDEMRLLFCVYSSLLLSHFVYTHRRFRPKRLFAIPKISFLLSKQTIHNSLQRFF